MDINKQWQFLQEAKFSNTQIHENMIIQALKKDSISTISLLKTKLRHKINWVVFFLILFLGMVIYFNDNLAIVSIMIFFILIYCSFLLVLYKEYKKMGLTESFDLSSNQCLTNNINFIKSAIKKETIIGIIAIPSMLVGGLLLRYLIRGQTLEYAIETSFTTENLILVSILGLLGFFWAIQANKAVFGSHIKALEKQLEYLKLGE